ncbi:MAG: hypothetical protein JW779_16495, partial [Candidatus Thorarchaeota archaeon]|nr:hypothetical protein [Candidatus Thorarchaeota archaeon]
SVTNFNYLQNSDGVSSHWEEAPINEDILSAHEDFIGGFDGWYEYPNNNIWYQIDTIDGYLGNSLFFDTTYLYSPIYNLEGYESFDWSLQYTNFVGTGPFCVEWRGDDGSWYIVAYLKTFELFYMIETCEIIGVSANNPTQELFFHSGFQVRLRIDPSIIPINDIIEVHDHALSATRYEYRFETEFYFTGADYGQAQEYLVVDFHHPTGDEGLVIEILNPSSQWVTLDTIGIPVPEDSLRSYEISEHLVSSSLTIRITDLCQGYSGEIGTSYWNIDAIFLNIYTVLPDDMTPSSIVSGGYGTVTDFAYMQDSPPLDGYAASLAEVSVPVVQWTTHS